MAWVIDLDGVVWLSGQPIRGAPEAISRLKKAGKTVVFLTNNSGPTVAEHVERLHRAGVPAAPEDLVTSAQAAASMLPRGSAAAVIGDEGIYEALTERSVEVVPAASHPGAVVVGRSVTLDYDELGAAASAIRDGARFVATNTDSTFPTPHGLLPGAGALVAFLSTASATEPEVAGKPHPATADLVRARYGAVSVVVGDRPDTDGRFATLIGTRFVLVLSGVTARKDLPVDPAPDSMYDDLASAVSDHLESGARGAPEARPST